MLNGTGSVLPWSAQILGCEDHVERYRQRATLVDVVQPQLRPGELPLHVTVLLHPTTVTSVTGHFSTDEGFRREAETSINSMLFWLY